MSIGESINLDDFIEPSDASATAMVFDILAKYCRMKAAAMVNRLEGNIAAALIYEGYCDDLYSKLPEDCRW